MRSLRTAPKWSLVGVGDWALKAFGTLVQDVSVMPTALTVS